MRTLNQMLDYGGTRVEAACETVLLDRIGRELALIYHDTLQSPLSPALREVVERLDAGSAPDEGRAPAKA